MPNNTDPPGLLLVLLARCQTVAELAALWEIGRWQIYRSEFTKRRKQIEDGINE